MVKWKAEQREKGRGMRLGVLLLGVLLSSARVALADACCGLGLCFDTTPANCTLGGGTPSPGVLCTATPFPCGGTGPFGACCDNPVQLCGYGPQASCVGFGGTYQGDGTVCNPDPCAVIPVGSCCLPAPNGCQILTEVQCDLVTGTYGGDGTTCVPDPCVPTCAIGLIQPIGRLLAVKTGADVRLSWTPDINASAYNLWYVPDKAFIPASSQEPASVLVCTNVNPTCLHTAAVTGPAGTKLHYNALGVCNGTEAPL